MRQSRYRQYRALPVTSFLESTRPTTGAMDDGGGNFSHIYFHLKSSFFHLLLRKFDFLYIVLQYYVK